MSEFIKQTIISYFKERLIPGEEYFYRNFIQSKLRRNPSHFFGQQLLASMIHGDRGMIISMGRKIGNRYAFQQYVDSLEKEFIRISDKIPDESLRGYAPADLFLRDKYGRVIDPDIGILPANIKEVWDSCMPKLNKSKEFGTLLFFVTSENSSTGKYYNDLLYNTSKDLGPGLVEQIRNNFKPE